MLALDLYTLYTTSKTCIDASIVFVFCIVFVFVYWYVLHVLCKGSTSPTSIL